MCLWLPAGASLVTHSTTKFLSGHGNSMGGVVIDSGQTQGNPLKAVSVSVLVLVSVSCA